MSAAPLAPNLIKYEGRDFTKAEAEALTSSIRAYGKQLCFKLADAHDGKAYKAMGYDTFAAYLDEACDISRSRGYQRLAEARSLQLLAVAADLDAEQMSTMVDIPERVLRDADVEAAAAAVKAAIEAGATEAQRAEVVEAAVLASQTTTKTETYTETTTTNFDADTGEISPPVTTEPPSVEPGGDGEAGPAPAPEATSGDPAPLLVAETEPEGSSSLTGEDGPAEADSAGSETEPAADPLSDAIQARPKLNKALAAMDADTVAPLLDVEGRQSWQRTVNAVADWVDAWTDALEATPGLTLIEGSGS